MTSSLRTTASQHRGRRVWAYRPELDGLRTMAVVVIVYFHVGVQGAASSFIMLDLFFVLSGFLVTNVVLTEIDERGSLRLGRYYARRVRRLLPAAVVTILVTSVVFVLVASEPERLALVRHAQAALVYLANWQFVLESADYFAGDVRESPFMHFWSLSVEEQYYIFFPLLVVGVLRLAPGRPRVLLAAFGALIAASLASQLFWAQVDPSRAYYATDARLFQLLAGAAMAVALREFAVRGVAEDGGVAWPRAGRALAVLGLGGYLLFGTELIAMSVSHRNLVATLLATALVLGVYTAPGSLVARGFALPWMTYLGKISYGIYLWHWPTALVLERVFEVPPAVIATMALVLAIAMASMSYHLLETPIRTSRRLEPFPWPAVASGLTVSLVAAAIVVGPVLTSPRAPALSAPAGAVTTEAARGDRITRLLERPVPRLDFKRLAADKGVSAGLCTVEEPDGCLLHDEGADAPHVVLVGDSHARTMAPMMQLLAREHGFTLSTSIVTSCPWQDGVYNATQNQANCRNDRRGFYDEVLGAMGADIVILANMARSDTSWEGALVDGRGRAVDLHRLQRTGTERTVAKIHAAGAQAVLVHSMLGTEGWDREGFDPLDCLARAEEQGECVVHPPMDRPFVDSVYRVLADESDDTAVLDLNPVICPTSPFCRPIIDGRVVWRNENHLTTIVLRHLRDEVWTVLEGTGFFDRERGRG